MDLAIWQPFFTARSLRDPRIIDTSSNGVTVSKEEARILRMKLFPEGTCASCQNITLHDLFKVDDRADAYLGVDYDLGMHTNCPMCKLVFGLVDPEKNLTGNKTLAFHVEGSKLGFNMGTETQRPNMRTGTRRHNTRPGTRSHRSWVKIMPPGLTGGSCNRVASLLRVYTEPGSYASKFVPGLRAPSSNLSETTFRNVCCWIKECEETHTTCRSFSSQFSETKTRHLPTRVIHVGSATREPHLHISQTHESHHYIALSHCWGRNPQVRTLKANIEQFREEILVSSLSKTFQDAIYVARRLDIEYIWIDSLCIVQDDADDWLQESERMGSIYANAYITIAATSAVDGKDGLDSVRPSCNWIRFPFDGMDEAKGYVWFTDGLWNSQTDLGDAPLNARGWVFQEKALSRRIIHYAASQVYWECKQRFSGEENEDLESFGGENVALNPSLFWTHVNAVSHTRSMSIERSNGAGDHDSRDSTSQLSEFYESWRSFVGYYCTRNFSKQSDRLVALLGIIRAVEKQTGLRCVDGHWDDGSRQFVHELMWFPEKSRMTSVLDDGRRDRLCSSWSWASLEGPLDHRPYTKHPGDAWETWKRYGLKNCNLLLMAIEDQIQIPWPSHPLKVSGMLRTFFKCELRQDRDEGWTRRTFEVKAELSRAVDGWICFDCENEELEVFHFSPVYIYNWRIACLALVQRHGPESTKRYFERIGAGYIDCDGIDLFETCEACIYYLI